MAKRSNKADDETMTLEEALATPVEKEPKAEVRKKAFVSTDGIMCRSVTPGSLFVDGPKTGMTYIFSDYGDETEIEYRDLKAMVMTKSINVFGPRIIVDDADFIAEMPQLSSFYDKQYSVKDLKKILDLPINEMVSKIKELPVNAQNNLKTLAASAIEKGTIDSIRKIRALDELWGTQFDFFSSTEE